MAGPDTQSDSTYGRLRASEPPRPWWRNLWPRRVGHRLALGFGTLVALMLLALSQAGWQLHQVSDITRSFATGDMQRLLRVQGLSLQTEGVGSALVRLMNAPRANRVNEYADVDERNRRIDGIIGSLLNDLKDPEQVATLQRLKACQLQYREAFLATVDEIEKNDLLAAARELNDKVNPALKAMLFESNTLLARERMRIEKELDDAQRLFERVAAWVAVLSALVTGLAALLAWRTTLSVVRPLDALGRAARAIAKGDYASRVPSTYTREADRVGDALNTMAAAVSQREQQIVRLAYHDTLTGLPNRTALLEPVSGNVHAHSTVMLMDLARLKTINETLGFATGDTLIKAMAVRAQSVFEVATRSALISEDPVVARLSGGTFAAWFTAPDHAAVELLRDRVEHAIAEPIQCGGYSVDLSLTYGLADTLRGEGAYPVQQLLRNAEVALHSAKRAAAGFAWHSEAQEAARLHHLSLLSDLRSAVQTSQLEMWLQPKYALQSGQAVGAEALVRWRHPVRGLVSPAEFVPFAEQTGYITMVTAWMLEQALRTLTAWSRTHPQLTIAVNISTRDLQVEGFAASVQSLVASHGVAPDRLRLEITESGLMQDAQSSLALLHALHATGTPLSIDDFGTGYSSLAYLQKMPVSELKIDRSFVDGIDREPGTQRLVKAMIEMGHGLGMTVTGEGVETEAERNVLRELGCDVMQGYFASKPLHGDALVAWLKSI